jgi:hypothetical protein
MQPNTSLSLAKALIGDRHRAAMRNRRVHPSRPSETADRVPAVRVLWSMAARGLTRLRNALAVSSTFEPAERSDATAASAERLPQSSVKSSGSW